MGLFGWNAEKKLAKGEEQLAKGLFYEARLTFEEIIVHEKVESSIASQAKGGWRKARAALIANQMSEAENLLRSGDTAQAADCWRAIIELAGNDLDCSEARDLLARHGGKPSLRSQVLEGLDSVAAEERLPAEEEEEQEEYAAEDPDQIFEVYLQTLPEGQAEAYRALGEAFRDGYLLIQEGRAQEALDRFAAAGDQEARSPYFQLEVAQALLLAERNEEAVAGLEAVEGAPEIRRRVAEMRAILHERLGRHDEAEAEAKIVWEDGKSIDGAIFYAELLVDHGRFEPALEILKPMVHPARPQAEIDRLAARAHAGLGQTGETRSLLERLVESFFQGPIGMRDAPPFPLLAARDLVELYMAGGESMDRIRSLIQHLIRHDPEHAGTYKARLAAYAESLEAGGKPEGPDDETGSAGAEGRAGAPE